YFIERYVALGTMSRAVSQIFPSADSAVIARGKYLAYGPAHCAQCHVPLDKVVEVENGKEIPMMGGFTFKLPPGHFPTPNITPDEETGIGKYTDGQLARAMRHSIKANGDAMFPIMPFQELSDEDLTAIVSFLRSQPAVKHEVPAKSYTMLGKALAAFGALDPVGPKKTPPKSVPIAATAEYGAYLANSVANCNGCHTERDLKTGAFIGAPFAGGFYFEPDDFSKGYSFVSPNITPDKQTSVIGQMDESAFITRFRQGRVHAGSPMPWGAYAKMTELELQALYRYLQTVTPVEKAYDQLVFEPGEEYAGS
ncbi:MAG: c-type cytochrome, partial [Bacteroidota bacterium]